MGRRFFTPGLTKAQQSVFEQIAIGQLPYARQSTIDILVEKGLIVRIADRVLGRDRFGAISVPTYEVPLPIHIRWCEWCAKQPEADL